MYLTSILASNLDPDHDSCHGTYQGSYLERDLLSDLDPNLDSHQDSYFGSDQDSYLGSCLVSDHGSNLDSYQGPSLDSCLDRNPLDNASIFTTLSAWKRRGRRQQSRSWSSAVLVLTLSGHSPY